jgi:hypothetical protein
MRDTRRISWIKAARRDFEEFPKDVQGDMLDALTVAAEGAKSEKANRSKAWMAVSSKSLCDIAAMRFGRSMQSRSTWTSE